MIPSGDAIETAIKTGFTRLDDEIVHQSVQKVLQSNNKIVAAEMLAPALSGSCALLSFYDSRSKLLRVACTGDSRAVLGRRSESGKWTATPLSVDQTGGNPDEAARMRKLHPGRSMSSATGEVLRRPGAYSGFRGCFATSGHVKCRIVFARSSSDGVCLLSGRRRRARDGRTRGHNDQ